MTARSVHAEDHLHQIYKSTGWVVVVAACTLSVLRSGEEQFAISARSEHTILYSRDAIAGARIETCLFSVIGGASRARSLIETLPKSKSR